MKNRLYISFILLLSVSIYLVAGTGGKKNLTETIASKESFSQFSSAVEKAGLQEFLNEKGTFTIFVPSDDAFDKLPQDKRDALLEPENKNALKLFLASHIISGRFNEELVSVHPMLKSLNGGYLKISKDGNDLRVNGTRINQTDILSGNGVIHVIDEVLMPKNYHSSKYHGCPYLQEAREKGCPYFSGKGKEAKQTRFSPGKAL